MSTEREELARVIAELRVMGGVDIQMFTCTVKAEERVESRAADLIVSLSERAETAERELDVLNYHDAQISEIAGMLRKQRDELAAVIERATGWTDPNNAPGFTPENRLAEIDDALHSAPADILTEHDKRILIEYEERRKPAPIHIDNIDGVDAKQWLTENDKAVATECARIVEGEIERTSYSPRRDAAAAIRARYGIEAEA